jgi:hypothetical protein
MTGAFAKHLGSHPATTGRAAAGLKRRGPCNLCFGLMQAVCGYFFAFDPTPLVRRWIAAAVTRR